jgi:hypothetical protein
MRFTKLHVVAAWVEIVNQQYRQQQIERTNQQAQPLDLICAADEQQCDGTAQGQKNNHAQYR